MPLDALFLQGLTRELDSALAGARIDKIHQPARDEVALALRAPAGNVRLLLSANPSAPRLHLTGLHRENPDSPPMFCMLLRKHLSGARLLEIVQEPMERVVRLHLEATDELGDRVRRQLVLEAVGRQANLLLLDDQGVISGCLRRTEGDMTGGRPVLPGLFYRLPVPQEKKNPAALTRRELEDLLSRAPEEAPAHAWLLDTFGGLSPLLCRELAFRAGGDVDARLNTLGERGRARLLDELEGLLALVSSGKPVPTLLLRDGRETDFTFLPILQYGPTGPCVPLPDFSQLLERFYAGRETEQRRRQQGQDVLRAVSTARDRLRRKLGLQRRELERAENRESLRRMGDLITGNLHTMSRGMSLLKAADFYDEAGGEVEIPLDPLLTPQQNAARYYKNYTRAKTAQEMLTRQMELGAQELEYLDSVLDSLSRAEGERELREIRQELVDTGYLRAPAKPKGKVRVKRQAGQPMTFRSTGGLTILVGKNNTQNDLLTTKLADKRDLWFHAQKIGGAHVILQTGGQQPDSACVEEAASLAAWFSQGRDSGRVAVDCTQVKFVKKPAGARPGMVIYTTHQTVLAPADETLVKKLEEHAGGTD